MLKLKYPLFDGKRVWEGACVRVEDSVITSVRACALAQCGEGFLLPGLIDAHTHMGTASQVQAGYVKHIGLSMVDAEPLRRVCKVHPIHTVEMEYSLVEGNRIIAYSDVLRSKPARHVVTGTQSGRRILLSACQIRSEGNPPTIPYDAQIVLMPLRGVICAVSLRYMVEDLEKGQTPVFTERKRRLPEKLRSCVVSPHAGPLRSILINRRRPSRPSFLRACRSRRKPYPAAPAGRGCSGWTYRPLPSFSARKTLRRTTWS